jgi:hypothetical protein
MSASNGSDTPTRLRMALSPVSGGRLDGAWWPHTTDLEVELADLVDHFPEKAGRINRVVFSRPDWGTTPHKVKIARGTLKTGSFPADDTHLMVLSLSTMAQIDLLVIPPETDSDTAEALMVSATAPANVSTGSQLLAAARGPAGSSGD